MTITPTAGTYMVWFASSVQNSGGSTDIFMSIYAGGVQVAASEVRADQSAGSHDSPFCAIAMVTVNGAQAIEGRRRVAANTGTMHQRTLMFLQVA